MRFGELGITNLCTLASQHFETDDIIAFLRDNDELDAAVYRAQSTHVLCEQKRSQEVHVKNLLDPILDASTKFEA